MEKLYFRPFFELLVNKGGKKKKYYPAGMHVSHSVISDMAGTHTVFGFVFFSKQSPSLEWGQAKKF